MSELTTWLLEQIAADEAVARAATGGPWTRYGYRDGCSVEGAGIVFTDERTLRNDATHIARHDPARVLAECAAKRRIVEPWVGTVTANESYELRALASVYAGADGWREEWA